ncbi:hypothetical protein JSQ81_13905 [Sporosarcina sp. Marseille-Q4063]|uniref:hypothetical protein n=1 Tax=Sporosarcina sp. Marseille-Q4063 TaxID=2810514 RepID=UPI001BAE6A58|nr:hypothetical protein [Sporosarcina sp. Marseille-Q4063]QUW20906.1 hypothetical protein JSQ81_13905 [Sporosarcina sp. Marseille-Q4063]
MEDVYQKQIKNVEALKEQYLNSLSEEERNKYLLSILRDIPYLRQNPVMLRNQDFKYSTRESRETVYQCATISSDSCQNPPIRLKYYEATKNGNFRARCFCDAVSTCPSDYNGISWVSTYYNYGKGDGRYDIEVSINHFGLEYYGIGDSAWDKFIRAPIAYQHFTSARLSGGEGGRGDYGDYFQNGNNQTKGPNTGTLGVKVFEKGTMNQIWWGLWYFNYGNLGFGNSWGDAWMRCGHDYEFRFDDI